MNKIYTLIILIGSLNSIFSQSKFSGVVTSESVPLSSVEIINLTKKKFTKSNDRGEFEIQADINDEITFYLKDFIQRNEKLKNEHLTTHNNIVLVKRPIELEEVKIVKGPKLSVINDYESLKIAKIQKEQLRPKVTGVYTGEIQNGVDFMAIGGKLVNLIGKIFKKNEGVTKNKMKISFEDYIVKNFGQDYLLKKLNLQENEFELFLKFCENDNQTASVINNDNKLDVLEFLMKKAKEFKP